MKPYIDSLIQRVILRLLTEPVAYGLKSDRGHLSILSQVIVDDLSVVLRIIAFHVEGVFITERLEGT
jgi:hypothetical protein